MWPDAGTIPLTVEAAFGADLTAAPSTWAWTDLSSRRLDTAVQLRAGRSAGAPHASPGTCTITLDNDGALTPLQPTSPYWPHVRRGTPLRVSITRVVDEFGRTSAADWGAADSGQMWTGVGVGAPILASDFQVAAGAATHSVPTTSAYRLSYLAGVSLADCTVTLTDVVVPISDVTGGTIEPANIALRATSTSSYYLARVEITTAEAVVCRLYDRSGVQLASATVPGLTHTAAQALTVRAQTEGTALRMKVWPTAGTEPAGWHVEATGLADQAPGWVGVRTGVGAGNSNTKPVVASYGAVTVDAIRFAGFADQWEPTFQPRTDGTAASVVRVTASGLLRSLEQGSRPLLSAPRRYLPTTSPVAYWPLEDGLLVQEGTALAGAQPMRPFTGTHPSGAVISSPQWGRGDLAPWLPEVLSRRGNAGLTVIWAPVNMASTTRWVIDFIYRSGTDAGDSTVDVNPSYLPGGAIAWPQLLFGPGVRGLDVAMNGEPEVTATAATLYDGQPHHIRWDAFQDGAKVSWLVFVDAIAVNWGTTAGNMTFPAMQTVGLAASAQAGGELAQGHVAVWTSPPPVEDAVDAAFGHAGEAAAARIARLCGEESIAVSVSAGDSEPMGPQGVAGVVELLREAEETDMGVLGERGFGLDYLPRGGRYNPAVAMTVDLAAYRLTSGGSGEVLAPALDDRGVRNEWTVSRTYADVPVTAVDSVHQAQSGVYTDSATVTVAADGRLADHASWRVHLGTVEALREAAFPLDLGANPDLVEAWLNCRVGSRILRTTPPAVYGPGPIDTLVEGWSERIGPRSWTAQVTPTPAEPWMVAELDHEVLAYLGSDGSTVAAPFDAGSDTSLSVSVAAGYPRWQTGPTWITIATSGVSLAAEQITDRAQDWFARSSSSDWSTASSGQAWTTTGGSPSDYSVTGG